MLKNAQTFNHFLKIKYLFCLKKTSNGVSNIIHVHTLAHFLCLYTWNTSLCLGDINKLKSLSLRHKKIIHYTKPTTVHIYVPCTHFRFYVVLCGSWYHLSLQCWQVKGSRHRHLWLLLISGIHFQNAYTYSYIKMDVNNMYWKSTDL